MPASPDHAKRSTGIAQLRWLWLTRGSATLLRILGFELASRLAVHLARGVHDLDPPLRRQIAERIDSAGLTFEGKCGVGLAQSPVRFAERKPLDCPPTRDVFEHAARFWIESLFIPRHLRPPGLLQHIHWHDQTSWHALERSPGPLVLLAPQLGNPLIGALAIAHRLGPVQVAVDAASFLLIRTAWPGRVTADRRLRGMGIQLLLPSDVGQMRDALEKGGRVCWIGARARPGGGLAVPFLGATVTLSPRPFRLARATGASVFAWNCTRDANPAGRFDIHAAPPIQPSRSLQSDAERIAGSFEEMIRRAPSQYLWTRA